MYLRRLLFPCCPLPFHCHVDLHTVLSMLSFNSFNEITLLTIFLPQTVLYQLWSRLATSSYLNTSSLILPLSSTPKRPPNDPSYKHIILPRPCVKLLDSDKLPGTASRPSLVRDSLFCSHQDFSHLPAPRYGLAPRYDSPPPIF